MLSQMEKFNEFSKSKVKKRNWFRFFTWSVEVSVISEASAALNSRGFFQSRILLYIIKFCDRITMWNNYPLGEFYHDLL